MEHGAIDLHKKESQVRILTESGEVIDQRIRTTRDRLTNALRPLVAEVPIVKRLTTCLRLSALASWLQGWAAGTQGFSPMQSTGIVLAEILNAAWMVWCSSSPGGCRIASRRRLAVEQGLVDGGCRVRFGRGTSLPLLPRAGATTTALAGCAAAASGSPRLGVLLGHRKLLGEADAMSVFTVITHTPSVHYTS
jgi:hypothetical protein